MTQADQAPTPIYTVGYGSRSVEELIALLHVHGITYLVDVRTAPYSRYKPEFSRQPLAAVLDTVGIHYLYMGDTLGGRPDDPACYTDGRVDYDKVRTTPRYGQGIERIRTAFHQQRRIALLCSEGKPEMCHRSKLIGETLDRLGIPVLHIDEADTLRTQDEVRRRLTAGQLSLFDDLNLRSRKRYQTAEQDRKDMEYDHDEQDEQGSNDECGYIKAFPSARAINPPGGHHRSLWF
jgi:uncharacterized protein (DUF488 family)